MIEQEIEPVKILPPTPLIQLTRSQLYQMEPPSLTIQTATGPRKPKEQTPLFPLSSLLGISIISILVLSMVYYLVSCKRP